MDNCGSANEPQLLALFKGQRNAHSPISFFPTQLLTAFSSHLTKAQEGVVVQCELDEQVQSTTRVATGRLVLQPHEAGRLVLVHKRFVPPVQLQGVAFIPHSCCLAPAQDKAETHHNKHQPESESVQLCKHAHQVLFQHMHLTWHAAAGDHAGVVPIDVQKHLGVDVVRPLFVSPIELCLEVKGSGHGGAQQGWWWLTATATATSVFDQDMPGKVCVVIEAEAAKHSLALGGTASRVFDRLATQGTAQHSLDVVVVPNQQHTSQPCVVVVRARVVCCWGTAATATKVVHLHTTTHNQ